MLKAYSGKGFDLKNPNPKKVFPEDIYRYSVFEHPKNERETLILRKFITEGLKPLSYNEGDIKVYALSKFPLAVIVDLKGKDQMAWVRGEEEDIGKLEQKIKEVKRETIKVISDNRSMGSILEFLGSSI